MSKSPAFQFYASDFLASTLSMSTEEIGAYIILLCIQWDQGGIPADQEKCARIARCGVDTVASIWHKFGISEGPLVKNKRLEEVRAKQKDRRLIQAENASKRWKNGKKEPTALPPHSDGNATAMPPHSDGIKTALPNACSPSPSPIILPLSSPEGDNEPVSSETETAEKKERGPLAATVAADAALRILAMFPGATQLSAVCQGQLHEHVANGTLPADEKKWRALAAMRAERAAIEGIPDDFDLRVAWLVSKERLCRDLAEALDTAAAKRPQPSDHSPEPKNVTTAIVEPPDWHARLLALYPNAHVTSVYADLPGDVRKEIEAMPAKELAQ